MLIARSEERESCSDAGVFWWKEFRLRRITADAYYDLGFKGPAKTWMVDCRYVCRLPDGRVVAKFDQGKLTEAVLNPTSADDAWGHPHWFGSCEREAVDEGLGDTDLLNAVSLHPLHAECVAWIRKLQAMCLDVRAAEANAASAAVAVDQFVLTETRTFNKKYASRSEAEQEKARQRTRTRLLPRLDALKLDVKVSASAFKLTKAKYTKARLQHQRFLKETA